MPFHTYIWIAKYVYFSWRKKEFYDQVRFQQFLLYLLYRGVHKLDLLIKVHKWVKLHWGADENFKEKSGNQRHMVKKEMLKFQIFKIPSMTALKMSQKVF